MEQSKLEKALAKNRAARISKQVDGQQDRPEKSRTITESPIIADMSPLSDSMARRASVNDMRNPNPMATSDMRNNKLIYAGMKNRAVLNAYRELRIQLMGNNHSGSLTVMISSADSDDNSIITAINLAISFSLNVQSSAVVVDCNPYGSGLNELVNADMQTGITDYMLSDSLPLESIIYPSGIDRVSVIPAGNHPEQAVELFSSKSMLQLITELKNRYSDRFIVLNAPPVLVSSEARVLTRYCDHTVLAIPYGKASLENIEDAVETIGAEHVSGVIYQQ